MTLFVLLAGIGRAPACMPFFCIACDSFLGVRGEVYEWLDAPAGAGSVIYLDSIPANNFQVAPISGVEIMLERWPKDAAHRDARIMKSNQDGRFGGGLVVGPGRFADQHPRSLRRGNRIGKGFSIPIGRESVPARR
jgi:hypothetical protein